MNKKETEEIAEEQEQEEQEEEEELIYNLHPDCIREINELVSINDDLYYTQSYDIHDIYDGYYGYDN
jgi:hypothetical protein